MLIVSFCEKKSVNFGNETRRKHFVFSNSFSLAPRWLYCWHIHETETHDLIIWQHNEISYQVITTLHILQCS